MSEEFIEDLFDFPGNLNPENVEQVITKAYLNLHELKKAGYRFNGANGKYTRKKKWLNSPKLICKDLGWEIHGQSQDYNNTKSK